MMERYEGETRWTEGVRVTTISRSRDGIFDHPHSSLLTKVCFRGEVSSDLLGDIVKTVATTICIAGIAATTIRPPDFRLECERPVSGERVRMERSAALPTFTALIGADAECLQPA